MGGQNEFIRFKKHDSDHRFSHSDYLSDDAKKDALTFARAIMVHAISVPHLSLCGSTKSLAHAERIWTHLTALREINPGAEGFFASHHKKPFFIDTEEAVGSHARDVIFTSIY